MEEITALHCSQHFYRNARGTHSSSDRDFNWDLGGEWRGALVDRIWFKNPDTWNLPSGNLPHL